MTTCEAITHSGNSCGRIGWRRTRDEGDKMCLCKVHAEERSDIFKMFGVEEGMNRLSAVYAGRIAYGHRLKNGTVQCRAVENQIAYNIFHGKHPSDVVCKK